MTDEPKKEETALSPATPAVSTEQLLSKLLDRIDNMSSQGSAIAARALGVDPRVYASMDWCKPGKVVELKGGQHGMVLSEQVGDGILVGLMHGHSEFRTVVHCQVYTLRPV